MIRKKIVYDVNGAVSRVWVRLAASKTFWVATVFILTAADRWNRGEITTGDFFQMVQIGVTGILIRAALSQAEMAANAANPALPQVNAEVRDQKLPSIAAATAACVIGAGALLTLTACTGLTTYAG